MNFSFYVNKAKSNQDSKVGTPQKTTMYLLLNWSKNLKIFCIVGDFMQVAYDKCSPHSKERANYVQNEFQKFATRINFWDCYTQSKKALQWLSCPLEVKKFICLEQGK